MPMHDWTRVDDGIYHDFYLSWIAAISAGLNSGRLPPDHYSLVERHTMDVSEWERGVPDGEYPARPPVHDEPGVFDLNEVPPSTPIRERCEELGYWRKARSVTIRSTEDDLAVAVIEVVTPAVKRVPVARQRFLDQMARAVYRGIHLLIIDPFVRREEKWSLAGDLWQHVSGRGLSVNTGNPATVVAAFTAGAAPEVFVDTVELGHVLPEMPLFLEPDSYLLVDLEVAYQRAWGGIAQFIRDELTDP